MEDKVKLIVSLILVFILNACTVTENFNDDISEIVPSNSEGTASDASEDIEGYQILMDNRGRLYNVTINELIAENVGAYVIKGTYVFYSVNNELFRFDMNQSVTQLIIELYLTEAFINEISSIQIFYEQLLINTVAHFVRAPTMTNFHYVVNLETNELLPLISIDSSQTQRFISEELGNYELEYPIGFAMQFNHGSTHGGSTFFVNPINGVVIRVTDLIKFGLFDNPIADINILTNEGVGGYYNVILTESEFVLTCVLTTGYSFIAGGNIRYFEETKIVFFDMVRSFYCLDNRSNK